MKTLVIDAPYLCHRSIYTMNSLSYENENTGVIFGFLMQLLSYAKEFQSNDIIFCWDSKTSKRKEIYPDYKNNRKKEELSEEDQIAKANGYKQFEIIQHEVLPAMGFNNVYHQSGYEADDLIATTVMYHEKDFVIITADQDMLQLLDYTSMWSPSSKIEIKYDDFVQTWGIEPEDWIIVKALAGCSSDNVAGLKGVGEKTAVKFIKNELKNTTKAFKTITNESKEILRINKPLVQLPFFGTKIYKIKENYLDFDNFVNAVCTRYSFDSFLSDSYFTKWENFFYGDF